MRTFRFGEPIDGDRRTCTVTCIATHYWDRFWHKQHVVGVLGDGRAYTHKNVFRVGWRGKEAGRPTDDRESPELMSSAWCLESCEHLRWLSTIWQDPLDLSFWSFLTFLHYGTEKVERHLLWKFHKKIQRKSWSNVPPKLLACVRFLYKVVHKNGRLRKFNHAREIEFNFFGNRSYTLTGRPLSFVLRDHEGFNKFW